MVNSCLDCFRSFCISSCFPWVISPNFSLSFQKIWIWSYSLLSHNNCPQSKLKSWVSRFGIMCLQLSCLYSLVLTFACRGLQFKHWHKSPWALLLRHPENQTSSKQTSWGLSFWPNGSLCSTCIRPRVWFLAPPHITAHYNPGSPMLFLVLQLILAILW